VAIFTTAVAIITTAVAIFTTAVVIREKKNFNSKETIRGVV
jgi:hypothetical protein